MSFDARRFHLCITPCRVFLGSRAPTGPIARKETSGCTSYTRRSCGANSLTSLIFANKPNDCLEIPLPVSSLLQARAGPYSVWATTSRGGVENTLECARPRNFRASISAARRKPVDASGRPIGISIAKTLRSGHLWRASSAAANTRHSENRPSSRATPSQPLLHPSRPATRMTARSIDT
jgi:hypothetical protein